VDHLKYARRAWHEQFAALLSTGRATEDLTDLLSGAVGVGVFLILPGVALGFVVGKAFAFLGVPTVVAIATATAVLSAPGFGYGGWAAVAAARTRASLVGVRRQGSDRRSGRKIGPRSIHFISRPKKYSIVIGVLWIMIVIPLILLSAA
jgi:hypothetical protein